MTPRLSLSIGLVLAASCGYTAPYQVSGPVSKQGVQLRLSGERCYVNRSAEQLPTTVGDDRLHVEVSLQIANTGTTPAQVSPNHFQLTEGGPGEKLVMRADQTDALTVLPNDTRTVRLDFEKETAADCRQEFALAATDAVALDGKPVDLDPIRFRADR